MAPTGCQHRPVPNENPLQVIAIARQYTIVFLNFLKLAFLLGQTLVHLISVRKT